MGAGEKADYSVLDTPEVLRALFHPRRETGPGVDQKQDSAIMIPVAGEVGVGARFHMTAPSGPNILFFHGNGEIVSDYDDLGPVYNRMGINFLVVDYRGYGRSGGEPSVSSMMTDGHVIFRFVRQWLKQNGYNGKLIVMGRSLGSASALELASAYPTQIDGLIVESGFARLQPLLRLLGIDARMVGYVEDSQGFNLAKIRSWAGPTLIIHAEHDHIIAYAEGQALYDACPAAQKTFLKIPGANHNDIFYRGLSAYMQAVNSLAHGE